jgi:hypothetical protein
MKKVNETPKKKLNLNKRTIMKLNPDMMVRLNGGVTTVEVPDGDPNSTLPIRCQPKSKVVDEATHCLNL